MKDAPNAYKCDMIWSMEAKVENVKLRYRHKKGGVKKQDIHMKIDNTNVHNFATE